MSRLEIPYYMRGAYEEGISMQVSGDSHIGLAKTMEDVMSLEVQARGRGQALLAVFDGHGGGEAAQFAAKELGSNIAGVPGFTSTESASVTRAISHGFQITHQKMRSVRDSWKPSPFGTMSTSGTTASLVVLRHDRMFVANVGDSAVVLGTDPNFSSKDCDSTRTPDEAATSSKSTAESSGKSIRKVCDSMTTDEAAISFSVSNAESSEKSIRKAVVLTDNHMADSEKEIRRIEQIGGQVQRTKATSKMKVVWLRKRQPSESLSSDPLQPEDLGPYEALPFLHVARSLGDLWSYAADHGQYLVSPVPDVTEYQLDLRRDRFVVLATHGVWIVMPAQEVIDFVHAFYQKEMAERGGPHGDSEVARALTKEVLKRWKTTYRNGPNISVMVVFFRGNFIASKFEEDTAALSGWEREQESARGAEKGSISMELDLTNTECENMTGPNKSRIYYEMNYIDSFTTPGSGSTADSVAENLPSAEQEASCDPNGSSKPEDDTQSSMPCRPDSPNSSPPFPFNGWWRSSGTSSAAEDTSGDHHHHITSSAPGLSATTLQSRKRGPVSLSQDAPTFPLLSPPDLASDLNDPQSGKTDPWLAALAAIGLRNL